MLILAIDPGPTTSGAVLFDAEERRVLKAEKEANNEALRQMIRKGSADLVLCEWIENYGMVVGKDVFCTVRWIGRFEEAAIGHRNPFTFDDKVLFDTVTRKQVKIQLCNSMQAKDKNVRQAVIDLFGGDEVALGRDPIGNGCDVCEAWPGSPCVSKAGKAMKSTHKGRAPKLGPLSVVSSHAWNALAVAVTWIELSKNCKGS